MIPLFLYAVVSAVTVRNIGPLPDRSFRFRLLAVALVLTVGFTMTFLTSWGVQEFLRSLPPPDGMVPGQWAVLGLYLAFGGELLMLMLVVTVSFMIRMKLNRRPSSQTPLS